MNFRKDINGLRAIAVIAVVFFHFSSKWVPGGFAGVDVFFVISGFLMTSIVFKGLNKNDFNLIRFYIARAKRILPALSVLCASLLTIGWFFFTPLDYALLGKHVASSMGFISNIVYFRESGYFDASSLDKWLLHTWSLSVEWQFYIIYPVVLLILKRVFGLNSVRQWILLLSGVGFFYCLFLSYFLPSQAFYLLPARSWEMMLGGIVYLYPIELKNSLKRALEWGGVTLILSAYFLLSETSLWPGYFSLLPVVGAMLILWSKREDSFLTNNYFSQKVGSASYSIYLWHWPIVVFFNYLEISEVKFQLVGISFSLILGWISFYIIEKRLAFSAPKISFIKIVSYPPIVFVFILGTLGSIIYLKKGIAPRLNDISLESIARSPKAYLCNGKIKNTCNFFYDNTQWATIGNSHSIEIAYALALRIKEQELGLRQFSLPACEMAYKRSIENDCVKWTKDAVNEIIKDEKIKNVVIAYRYTSSLFGNNIESYPALPDKHPALAENLSKSEGRDKILKSMLLMITDIAQKKEAVFVLLPIPELHKNINKIAFRESLLGNKISSLPGTSTKYFLERNKLVRNTILSASFPNNVFLVDPMKAFCDKEVCYAFINGIPLYFDDDHPSLKGAQMLVNELFNQLPRL